MFWEFSGGFPFLFLSFFVFFPFSFSFCNAPDRKKKDEFLFTSLHLLHLCTLKMEVCAWGGGKREKEPVFNFLAIHRKISNYFLQRTLSVAHHTTSLSKCQICTEVLTQCISFLFFFLFLLKLGQCYILDNPLKNLKYQQLVRFDFFFNGNCRCCSQVKRERERHKKFREKYFLILDLCVCVCTCVTTVLIGITLDHCELNPHLGMKSHILLSDWSRSNLTLTLHFK